MVARKFFSTISFSETVCPERGPRGTLGTWGPQGPRPPRDLGSIGVSWGNSGYPGEPKVPRGIWRCPNVPQDLWNILGSPWCPRPPKIYSYSGLVFRKPWGTPGAPQGTPKYLGYPRCTPGYPGVPGGPWGSMGWVGGRSPPQKVGGFWGVEGLPTNILYKS